MCLEVAAALISTLHWGVLAELHFSAFTFAVLPVIIFDGWLDIPQTLRLQWIFSSLLVCVIPSKG